MLYLEVSYGHNVAEHFKLLFGRENHRIIQYNELVLSTSSVFSLSSVDAVSACLHHLEILKILLVITSS